MTIAGVESHPVPAEKIKLGNHRVDIDKLQPENTTAPSVTGGYLVSIDKTKAGDPPQFYAANASMTYLDPDYYEITNRPAQQQYLSDYFNAFYAALTDPARWTDPNLGYRAYIDLDSWMGAKTRSLISFTCMPGTGGVFFSLLATKAPMALPARIPLVTAMWRLRHWSAEFPAA
jgi:hypothetical protein